MGGRFLLFSGHDGEVLDFDGKAYALYQGRDERGGVIMRNTLFEFVNFSLDLYDIYSGIMIEAEADHIDIHIDGQQKVVLWICNGQIYPEITHNFEGAEAVDLSTLKAILNVVEKYSS